MSIDRYGAVSRKCHAVMTQHNVFRLGRYLAAFTVVGWTGLHKATEGFGITLTDDTNKHIVLQIL
jgi:hypothetical protein